MQTILTMVTGCVLLSVCAFAQPHGNGIGFGPSNKSSEGYTEADAARPSLQLAKRQTQSASLIEKAYGKSKN